MKIFFAGISELVADRLSNYCRIHGFETVGHNCDIHEATRSIIEVKPDVVLLDTYLDGGTGIELIESIRKAGVRTKVILLARYGYQDLQNKCKDEEVNLMVRKLEAAELILDTLKFWDWGDNS